jgi:hypothetical protein
MIASGPSHKGLPQELEFVVRIVLRQSQLGSAA